MKAFLVFALLAVSLAQAKKGKGKKAKELSEDDVFACMDQTALGDKFMDALNNCMDLTTNSTNGGFNSTDGGFNSTSNGFNSTDGGFNSTSDGFNSTGEAAGRKGGKNKCRKYDAMMEKYIPEAETRACMLSNMGWIGNSYEPVMSVIKNDIASLDKTITKKYNPKTVKKCMKKELKKATKCSNDVDEETLTGVVFSFCSDRQFAKGCKKFIKKNMTQAGK